MIWYDDDERLVMVNVSHNDGVEYLTYYIEYSLIYDVLSGHFCVVMSGHSCVVMSGHSYVVASGRSFVVVNGCFFVRMNGPYVGVSG